MRESWGTLETDDDGHVPVGEVFSVTVPSSSQEGLFYTVRLLASGLWECSCPAFFYKDRCKHIDRTRQEYLNSQLEGLN